MSGRSPFAEGLATAGLCLLFFWGFQFLGVLAVAAFPCGALPVVRFSTRRGAFPGLLCAAVVAISSAAILLAVSRGGGALGEGVVIFLLMGSCAAAGGAARKRNPSHVFLTLAIAGALALGLGWASSGTAAKALAAQFDQKEKELVIRARAAGTDPATIGTFQQISEETKNLATRYAPGILGFAWICLVAIPFFAGRRLAALPDLPPGGDFSQFRLPPLLALLFVLSGAGGFLLQGTMRVISRDVLAAVVTLYFLCGLSIICYFARLTLRVRALRAAIYLLACWPWPPLPAVVAVPGLFDWYFDFRRRAQLGAREKK